MLRRLPPGVVGNILLPYGDFATTYAIRNSSGYARRLYEDRIGRNSELIDQIQTSIDNDDVALFDQLEIRYGINIGRIKVHLLINQAVALGIMAGPINLFRHIMDISNNPRLTIVEKTAIFIHMALDTELLMIFRTIDWYMVFDSILRLLPGELPRTGVYLNSTIAELIDSYNTHGSNVVQHQEAIANLPALDRTRDPAVARLMLLRLEVGRRIHLDIIRLTLNQPHLDNEAMNALVQIRANIDELFLRIRMYHYLVLIRGDLNAFSSDLPVRPNDYGLIDATHRYLYSTGWLKLLSVNLSNPSRYRELAELIVDGDLGYATFLAVASDPFKEPDIFVDTFISAITAHTNPIFCRRLRELIRQLMQPAFLSDFLNRKREVIRRLLWWFDRYGIWIRTRCSIPRSFLEGLQAV